MCVVFRCDDRVLQGLLAQHFGAFERKRDLKFRIALAVRHQLNQIVEHLFVMVQNHVHAV